MRKCNITPERYVLIMTISVDNNKIETMARDVLITSSSNKCLWTRIILLFMKKLAGAGRKFLEVRAGTPFPLHASDSSVR